MTQLPSRRHVLTAVAGGLGGAIVGTGAGVRPALATTRSPAARRRNYVLVVDGCRPDEITPALMPRLSALRTAGTSYPAAQSLPVMETIPNHVMMMGGLRPLRSGVPANSIYDRTEQVVRDLDRPTDWTARTTLFELLRARGRTSGTVLSKKYLFGIFGSRADYRWEPFPLVPVTNHAPDQFTADAAIAMVERADPDLVFASFGDVDRIGHSDLTGTTVRAARTAALASADAQIGRLLSHLVTTGRWRGSTVIVLADHSMDFSLPGALVTLTPAFSADPLLAGKVAIAQNGGADLLYFTGPRAERTAADALADPRPGRRAVGAHARRAAAQRARG